MDYEIEAKWIWPEAGAAVFPRASRKIFRHTPLYDLQLSVQSGETVAVYEIEKKRTPYISRTDSDWIQAVWSPKEGPEKEKVGQFQ